MIDDSIKRANNTKSKALMLLHFFMPKNNLGRPVEVFLYLIQKLCCPMGNFNGPYGQ